MRAPFVVNPGSGSCITRHGVVAGAGVGVPYVMLYTPTPTTARSRRKFPWPVYNDYGLYIPVGI